MTSLCSSQERIKLANSGAWDVMVCGGLGVRNVSLPFDSAITRKMHRVARDTMLGSTREWWGVWLTKGGSCHPALADCCHMELGLSVAWSLACRNPDPVSREIVLILDLGT